MAVGSPKRILFIEWDSSSSIPQFSHPLSSLTCLDEAWLWYSGYPANIESLLGERQYSQLMLKQALLNLIEKQGVLEVAQKMAGPFSWVYWQPARAELVICSDRLGLQPVYYLEHNGGIYLSNSINILLQQTGIPRCPNLYALATRIALMRPPAGQTFYQDIYCFQPASVAFIKGRQIRTQLYWQLESHPELQLDSNEAYEEAYLSLLGKVVDEHASREKVGITLSSGLDSSSIAAVLRLERPNDQIHALTWHFQDYPEADELNYVQETSTFLNFPLLSFPGDSAWTLSNIDSFTDSYLEPQVGFYPDLWREIFQLAQQHGIKTLLTGASGDFLFGTQLSSYPDLLLSLQWTELIRQMRRHISITTVPYPLLKIILRQLILPVLKPFSTVKAFSTPKWLKTPYQNYVAQNRQKIKILTNSNHFTLPGRTARLQLISILQYALGQLARNLTAENYGLELRHPFLDHRLIDFALALPAEQTYSAGWDKSIVRRALRFHLPNRIVSMRNKILIGEFGNSGLRNQATSNINQLMTDMRLAELGIIDLEHLYDAYRAFRERKTNDVRFVPTLTLEAWLRKWF